MRIWAFLLLLMSQSCSAGYKPVPELANCGGAGCHHNNASSQQGSGGGSNLDVDAGTGVALTVNAVAFEAAASDSRAWSLSNTKSVTEAVEVKAPSVSGSVVSESGPGRAVLSKVSTATYAWVSVRPTAKASVYLPGIVSIANWTSDEVDVPLLLNDDFSFVSGLYTTTTLSLDLTKAQVAIKIVDSQGNGVKNARIANPGADTVAYSNLGAWVDTSLDPATDISGRIVLVNFPAPTSPGGLVTIMAYGNNLAGSKVSTTVALPIQAGFVSYGTILLNLR